MAIILVQSPERRRWASKRERPPGVVGPALLFRLSSLSARCIRDRHGLAERQRVFLEEPLHPAAFLWGGTARFGNWLGFGWRRYGCRTELHGQIFVPEAHGDAAVQPSFDTHLRTAHSRAYLVTRKLVGLAAVLNRVAMADLPLIDMTENGCQCMLLEQGPVRVTGIARLDSERTIPPRQELLFQIGAGLFQTAGARHTQALHQTILCRGKT